MGIEQEMDSVIGGSPRKPYHDDKVNQNPGQTLSWAMAVATGDKAAAVALSAKFAQKVKVHRVLDDLAAGK